MTDIQITQKSHEEPEFLVVVTDKAGTKSRHTVQINETYYDNLTHGKMSREDLLRATFAFLLERESGEAILEEFELQDIMRYYPEYERAMRTIITQQNASR